MFVPNELDGAIVLKHTINDSNKHLKLMIFEEEDGTTTKVPITALAIAQYVNDDRYYIYSFVTRIGKYKMTIFLTQSMKQ
ncbi:hypothetical protein ACFVRR_17580 [Gottfriedia sp. NPDC057948]|uniref:hypothetical protein n=1 Tax=Gottfriedia sp. NPDC057948 TaxID=3346287 RepID=UPI0036D76102